VFGGDRVEVLAATSWLNRCASFRSCLGAGVVLSEVTDLRNYSISTGTSTQGGSLRCSCLSIRHQPDWEPLPDADFVQQVSGFVAGDA
jgi:hypothetical protein